MSWSAGHFYPGGIQLGLQKFRPVLRIHQGREVLGVAVQQGLSIQFPSIGKAAD
jgi:hypothetical protein